MHEKMPYDVKNKRKIETKRKGKERRLGVAEIHRKLEGHGGGNGGTAGSNARSMGALVV